LFLLGNVTVTAILDLSQGPLCNQSNVASLQSMNGMSSSYTN